MHRHGYQGRKLGREKGPRRALLRGLVTSLILFERIKTTEAKARELRPVADRLITGARRGTLADRRRAAGYLLSELAVEKLYTEVREVYAERTSGFTRLVKVGVRVGDGAPMAIVELVDYAPKKKREVKGEKPEKTETGTDTLDTKRDEPKAEAATETKKPVRKPRAAKPKTGASV